MMKLWLAKDEDGSDYLYMGKPRKEKQNGKIYFIGTNSSMAIPGTHARHIKPGTCREVILVNAHREG
jgi:hypothetical protein